MHHAVQSNHRAKLSAFTLVELLATIAIMAVLIVCALPYVADYTSWAREINDHQTLTILNDTLTRYKTEGGSLPALTAGAPISDVFALMQQPLTWANETHQVMKTGTTYPARSLAAAGNGTDYHFTQYDTYTETTPSISTPTSAHPYPYGYGVGYESNNNNASGYGVILNTSSGYFAVKPAGGAPTVYSSGSEADLSQAPSITYWSSDSSGNPSGNVQQIYDDANGDGDTNNPSNLTAMDVSGLTSLTFLDCTGNVLNSLNVSGCTALTSLSCYNNSLTSLNVSGCTALINLYCNSNNLTSLNVSGLTTLSILYCNNNSLTSLNVSGCTSLNWIDCNHNQLASLNVSGLSALSTLGCNNNSLTSLNLSGLTALSQAGCSHNLLGTINITGDNALLHGLDMPPQTSGWLVDTPQNGGYTPTVVGP